MSASFDQFWMRRAKILTQALIISGTMNIGLVGTSFYVILKEKQAALSAERLVPSTDPAIHISNEQILRIYSALSFQELLLKLENKDLAEEGYTKRDLALACLAAFHHFNVEKAVGGLISQKRTIYFRSADASEFIDVVALPGLTDEHFNAALHYARTEKWPLTSKGLFFELKRSFPRIDSSLMEAFFTTPEYYSIHTFFQKTGLPTEMNEIVSFLVDGEWESLKEFCEQQRMIQDFSVEKRRSFLLSYLDKYRSTQAAVLLTLHDLDFITRRLDDYSVGCFMQKIKEKEAPLGSMAKEILISPRADEVRKQAAAILYEMVKEPMPLEYDHLMAVQRFFPESLPQSVPDAQPAISKTKNVLEKVAEEIIKENLRSQVTSAKRVHRVQEGESLWKIARKYKVSVEEIKRLNQMDSDKLRAGKLLQLPEN